MYQRTGQLGPPLTKAPCASRRQLVDSLPESIRQSGCVRHRSSLRPLRAVVPNAGHERRAGSQGILCREWARRETPDKSAPRATHFIQRASVPNDSEKDADDFTINSGSSPICCRKAGKSNTGRCEADRPASGERLVAQRTPVRLLVRVQRRSGKTHRRGWLHTAPHTINFAEGHNRRVADWMRRSVSGGFPSDDSSTTSNWRSPRLRSLLPRVARKTFILHRRELRGCAAHELASSRLVGTFGVILPTTLQDKNGPETILSNTTLFSLLYDSILAGVSLPEYLGPLSFSQTISYAVQTALGRLGGCCSLTTVESVSVR